MKVIPHAGSIRSWIVITKNVQLGPFSNNNLLNVGKKIVRVNWWLISKQPTIMSPTGIEISQRYDPPVVMNLGEWTQEHFNTHFTLSIRTSGVGWVSLFAVILISIHSRSWWEYEIFTILVLLHHLEEIDRANHVVFIVNHRQLITLANSFLCCEMHNSINGLLLFLILFKDII